MEEIVAFARRGFRGGLPNVEGWPHEQIYDVGGMLVDERPDHPVVKIIEPATAKRKTIIGKIDYRPASTRRTSGRCARTSRSKAAIASSLEAGAKRRQNASERTAISV